MFSFHKPKIYRSNLGCCICKAKSSSSRFTDSKKYENEFENCFRIQEKRSGEICNACVLLVKRWKKLSPENRLTKHWNHVVDARAGPGTKLTNGRRLTATNSNSSSSSSSSTSTSSSLAGSSASVATGSRARDHESTSGNNKRRSDVLPLSSSQSNNQTPAGSNNSADKNERSSGKRFSVNKARAIDTNVSTFTFGEPIRRNYMLTESGSTGYANTGSYSSSSATFSKPQSALNSSAFELVIKRFRQRQQQQQLEAQRRELTRKQKLQQQQSSDKKLAESEVKEKVSTDTVKLSETKKVENGVAVSEQSKELLTAPVVSKRVKRSSECIGSLSVDGLRVSSLLDASMWRKERICCGIIFRGINNEVAVFPKLLKPCQCRIKKLREERSLIERTKTFSSSAEDQESTVPPNLIEPRAIKSGSISSCDSNTSGTGSMEQPMATDQELISFEKQHLLPAAKRQRRPGKVALMSQEQQAEASLQQSNRKPLIRRRAQIVVRGGTKNLSAQTAVATSGRSRSAAARKQLAENSPSSSSETSSSRLYLMEDEIDNQDDEGDEMEIDDDEEEFDDDEDDDDEEDDDEEAEEEEEEDEEELSLEDEEQISPTSSNSGIENLANIERKKSTVGAIG